MSKQKKEKAARIAVYWPDDWKEVTLIPRNWKKVKNGKPVFIRGNGYYYEAEFFWDYWSFGGGLDGDLIVGYGDGGMGSIGTLSDARIEEFDYTPIKRGRKNAKQ